MGNKKSATVVGDVVGKYRPSEISLGYCDVPENKQCGPTPNPQVPPGSTVTNQMKESSLQIQFTIWGK